jgi:hypothetical protein
MRASQTPSSGSLLGWDMRASWLESGLLDPIKSTLIFDHESGSREERIGPFSYFSKVQMRHRSHGRFWVWDAPHRRLRIGGSASEARAR